MCFGFGGSGVERLLRGQIFLLHVHLPNTTTPKVHVIGNPHFEFLVQTEVIV